MARLGLAGKKYKGRRGSIVVSSVCSSLTSQLKLVLAICSLFPLKLIWVNPSTNIRITSTFQDGSLQSVSTNIFFFLLLLRCHVLAQGSNTASRGLLALTCLLPALSAVIFLVSASFAAGSPVLETRQVTCGTQTCAAGQYCCRGGPFTTDGPRYYCISKGGACPL